MCGIIGAFNYGKQAEDANEAVLNLLQDQISRGREGFGISFIDDKFQVDTKRATIESKTILDLYINKAKMIVMHHRMPTSSENKISQTHPILVDNGSLAHKYLVVHNGIVRNCKALRKKHEEELGFVYTTPRIRHWYNSSEEEFNDSESLAVELAMYIEGQTKELDIEGSAAFIVIQMDKQDKAKKIFYGRNEDSPLKLSASSGKIHLSSEGAGENIAPFFLYNFDIDVCKIKKSELKFKEPKPFEIKREFLPSVSTDKDDKDDKDDKKVVGFTADEDDWEDYNGYSRKSYNGYNADVPEVEIAEMFEDNRVAAEGALEDFFEMLSDEERLLSEDLEELVKDTMRNLSIELKEAKDKAIDAFASIYEEKTLQFEEKKSKTKEFTNKFNSK